MPSGPRPIPFTDEQVGQMDRRYRDGETLEALARDFGVTGPTIRARLTRLGTPLRGRHARGDRHGWWRGGRTVDSNGYVRCWVDRADPLYAMANAAGQITEHRLVMARSLGRPLTRDETVHHINGDRRDNRPENLQLRSGLHGKGQAATCRSCGSHDIEYKEI